MPFRHSCEWKAVSRKIQAGNRPPEPVVSFTFDDGPGENTAEILKLLKQYEATATFFINGKNIEGRENTLKTAVAWGNELGNHTYGHIALTDLTDDRLKEEIERTQKAVKAVLPDYIAIRQAALWQVKREDGGRDRVHRIVDDRQWGLARNWPRGNQEKCVKPHKRRRHCGVS